MATSQNVFYQLAFHRQSSHILPNLERLRWSAAPRLIILFLCPTLRALEMASSEYETGIFSEVEMRLSAANLKTLKLEVEEPSSHLDPTLEELSRLFEWAEELTDVTLSRGLVDSPVFISLSKLPQLRVLRIIGRLQSGLLFDFATTRGLARPSKAKRIKPAVPKAKSKWVTGRTPVATTGGWAAQSESDEWYESFPELRSLDLVITVNAAGFFSDVRCISSIGLASITITFSGNLVKDLKDILVAISERCPGLQYLNIRPDNEHYNFIEADTRMQDVYQKPHRVQRISRSLITVDFFKPILMLKELEELVLEWPYAAQVNQADMQLMVNSWPNIVSLYITPAPFFILPERPRLHITCLKHIFVRTTQLKRLALFIDATRETGQSNEGIGVQAGVETLEEFDPGRSWISDRAYALDHLQEAFPNVRIPAVERRLTRWGDVARSLKSGMPIPAVTESAPKARPYVLRRVRP
ncbi:hypothetical protein FRB95_001781 [Tulasnella sp. JGI-2019a]|nr:hypothetical protein FRB95_001781 [Tulasnella sp. JGI-2019a]